MVVNHPVSNLVASLKNGQMAKRKFIEVGASKLVDSILDVLKDEGYIEGYSHKSNGAIKKTEIELRYFNYKPSIREIKVISTPGRRSYSSYNETPKVYNGLGMVILSTSKGVMSDHKARTEKVGGELLLKLF